MPIATTPPAGVSRTTIWKRLQSSRRQLARERSEDANPMGVLIESGLAGAMGYIFARSPQFQTLGPVDTRLAIGGGLIAWGMLGKGRTPALTKQAARAALLPWAYEQGARAATGV